MFSLGDFDPLVEALARLQGMLVTETNQRARELGLQEGKEVLSSFSFDAIDEFTRSVLGQKPFSYEGNIYLFNTSARYCRLEYNPENHLLILFDRSEWELLKKVKTDIVTSISHELRTPLSVAIGNVQMIRDFGTQENREVLVDKSLRSLHKIEKIISQLSLLTLAEFGNYSLRPEILSPQKVIEEVLLDLEEKARKKNISVKWECKVNTFEADRFVLYTILRNLVSNAIKYSHDGSDVQVSVRACKIQVKDFGIGIRENENIRIFERFFRGVDAVKHAKGSGLGLPIVKYLSELAGYKVEFQSTWMVGTTFTVHLGKKGA